MTIFDFIGLAADIAGLAALFFTAWVFFQAKRRLSQAVKSLQMEYSAAPVALAVGVGQDISGAVQKYIAASDKPQMPVHPYVRKGQVPKEEFLMVLQDMLKIKQELTGVGVTEVHLFYMGPVSLAVGIGAVFDNWVPVKVYRYVNGTYELDLVLHKETVLSLLNITAETGAEMLS